MLFGRLYGRLDSFKVCVDLLNRKFGIRDFNKVFWVIVINVSKERIMKRFREIGLIMS